MIDDLPQFTDEERDQAYGADLENAGYRSRRQRVKLQSTYLNSEGLLADIGDEKHSVLYGHLSKTYNPNTHVKVRVLHSEDFLVDLETGLMRNSQQFDEYDNP